MKGTLVVCCLRDLVIKRYGKPEWEKVLEMSDLPKGTTFSPTENAPDEIVLEVVNNICKILKITLSEAADTFGEYWVEAYAPKIYNNFHILACSAKDFVLKLNEIHSKVIRTMQDTEVPRFKFSWKDKETLILTYDSKWKLAPFFIGLVNGVAEYYEEDVSVNIWSSNQLLIKFQNTQRESASDGNLGNLTPSRRFLTLTI